MGVIYPLLGSVCGKPQWVSQASLSPWNSTSVLIVSVIAKQNTASCVTSNDIRLCLTVSVGQKFRLAQLVRARVSQAGVEVPARTGLSPETRGPHLRSRKLLVEFRSLRSCFLSGGSQGSHSASRGCPEALLTGPSPCGAAGDVFRASQGLSLRWSPVRCD